MTTNTKTKKTMVPAEKFETILNELGIGHGMQAGFVKCPINGRCLYIANTKAVGRIDISGHEFGEEFTKVPEGAPEGTAPQVNALGGESFGRVRQQVNFVGRTEDEILATTRELLVILRSLPPVEKAKREAAEATKKEKAKGFSEKVPVVASSKMTAEQKAERLAKIKAVAAEKGMEVSKKAEDELSPA